MRLHEVRSIDIDAPYEDVFTFIADPSNLPRWAHAFERADHSRALLRTPEGAADIGLAVRASREHGTIDWEMTFPDGNVASAMSRLTRGARQRVIYTFLLNAPPIPLERIEGALAEQAGTLELELATLRDLLTR